MSGIFKQSIKYPNYYYYYLYILFLGNLQIGKFYLLRRLKDNENTFIEKISENERNKTKE